MSKTLTAQKALLKRRIAIQMQYPCNHTKRRNRRPVGGLSQKRHCLKRERERESVVAAMSGRAFVLQCQRCVLRTERDAGSCDGNPVDFFHLSLCCPLRLLCTDTDREGGGTPLPLCLCDLTINSLRPVNFRCSLQYRNEVYISWHSQFIKLSDPSCDLTQYKRCSQRADRLLEKL